MSEIVTSTQAAKILGVTRRTLLRWEERKWLKSQRDERGNRVYDKDHVLLAKEAWNQWINIRRRHREHLRKLPNIQQGVERFVVSTPLQSTKSSSPSNIDELERVFERMEDWQKESYRIHQMYDKFLSSDIVEQAKSLAAGIDDDTIQQQVTKDAMRISSIADPSYFQNLCQAIFATHYDDFQDIDDSAGDDGIDGYTAREKILFAIYCPKKPREAKHYKQKIKEDLDKAERLAKEHPVYEIDTWVFVTPGPLLPDAFHYLQEEAQKRGFQGVSWSATKLGILFNDVPELRLQFQELAIPDLSSQIEGSEQRLSSQMGEGFVELATHLKSMSVESSRSGGELLKKYTDRIDAAKRDLDSGKVKVAKVTYESLVKEMKQDKSVNDPYLLFRAYNNLAICELELGDHDMAAQLFEEAHTFAPKDPKAISNLALARLIEGRAEEALEIVDSIKEPDSDDRNRVQVKAKILLELERYDELSEFLKSEGHEEDHMFFSALAFMDQEKMREAEKLLTKLATKNPDNVEYLNLAAQAILIDRQKYLMSHNVLPWKIPEDVLLSIKKAESYLTKAINILSDGEKNSQLAMAYVNRSALRSFLGKSDESLEDCKKAIDLKPDEKVAWLNKGKSELLSGKYDNAVHDLKQYNKLAKWQDKQGIRDLARAYLVAGDAGESKKLLEKYWSDEQVIAELDVADLALDIFDLCQEHEKVKELVNKLKSLDPPQPRVLSMLADFYQKQGNLEEAENSLKQAVEVAPAGDIPKLNLANFFFEGKRYKDALPLYHDLLNAEVNNEVSRNYFYCLYRLGRFGEALELAHSVKRDGFDRHFSPVEADIYKKLGNLEKAAEIYLTLFQKPPHNIEYLVEYGSCKFRLGDGEKAVHVFDRAKPKVVKPYDYVTLAVGYEFVGKAAVALELLYNALKKYPEVANVHLAYIGLFLRMEQREELVGEDKFGEAFRDTITNFNERFPNETGLQRIEDDKELTKLRSQLDSHADHTAKIVDFYKRGVLTMNKFAEFMGRSLLDVWYGLAADGDVGIHSAVGNQEEKDREAVSLSEHEDILLDLPVLLTLSVTKNFNLPRQLNVKKFVGQHSLDMLQDFLGHESSMVTKGYMIVGKKNGQYIRDEVTPEAVQLRLDKLRAIEKFIKEECDVIGLERELTEQEKKVAEVVGEVSGNDAALAQQRSLTLYTDDSVLRNLANTELSLKSFSTLSLVDYLAAEQTISKDDRAEALLQLMQYNFYYVSFDSDTLKLALQKDKYKFGPHLKKAVSMLGRGSTTVESLAVVVGGFLKNLWTGAIPSNIREAVLDQVLAGIVEDHSPVEVASALSDHLRKQMKLLVPQYVELSENIEAWFKARYPLIF